jgi:hypothetical protein
MAGRPPSDNPGREGGGSQKLSPMGTSMYQTQFGEEQLKAT